MKRTPDRSDGLIEGRPPAFSYREIRKGLFRRRPVGRITSLRRSSSRKTGGALRNAFVRLFRIHHSRPHAQLRACLPRDSTHSVLFGQSQFQSWDPSPAGRDGMWIRRSLGRRAGAGLASGPARCQKIVFSGVGKTAEEMLAALKAGVLLFNVESEAELWRLAECAARVKQKARIALRVNPDVPAKTHPYISPASTSTNFGYSTQRGTQVICASVRNEILSDRRRKRTYWLADY